VSEPPALAGGQFDFINEKLKAETATKADQKGFVSSSASSAISAFSPPGGARHMIPDELAAR
jgi:hypothetical protein